MARIPILLPFLLFFPFLLGTGIYFPGAEAKDYRVKMCGRKLFRSLGKICEGANTLKRSVWSEPPNSSTSTLDSSSACNGPLCLSPYSRKLTLIKVLIDYLHKQQDELKEPHDRELKMWLKLKPYIVNDIKGMNEAVNPENEEAEQQLHNSNLSSPSSSSPSSSERQWYSKDGIRLKRSLHDKCCRLGCSLHELFVEMEC